MGRGEVQGPRRSSCHLLPLLLGALGVGVGGHGGGGMPVMGSDGVARCTCGCSAGVGGLGSCTQASRKGTRFHVKIQSDGLSRASEGAIDQLCRWAGSARCPRRCMHALHTRHCFPSPPHAAQLPAPFHAASLSPAPVAGPPAETADSAASSPGAATGPEPALPPPCSPAVLLRPARCSVLWARSGGVLVSWPAQSTFPSAGEQDASNSGCT